MIQLSHSVTVHTFFINRTIIHIILFLLKHYTIYIIIYKSSIRVVYIGDLY